MQNVGADATCVPRSASPEPSGARQVGHSPSPRRTRAAQPSQQHACPQVKRTVRGRSSHTTHSRGSSAGPAGPAGSACPAGPAGASSLSAGRETTAAGMACAGSHPVTRSCIGGAQGAMRELGVGWSAKSIACSRSSASSMGMRSSLYSSVSPQTISRRPQATSTGQSPADASGSARARARWPKLLLPPLLPLLPPLPPLPLLRFVGGCGGVHRSGSSGVLSISLQCWRRPTAGRATRVTRQVIPKA